jgi:ubiquinone/menaquinone biosynthesis C-methylase UbiE
MARVENACAGPFGAIYDLWIERERVARVVGWLIWGIDTRPMFAAIRRSIAAVPDGSTILDVPCGGGVAFRALRPTQRVRYVAVDLDDEMLARARRCADDLHLDQIELVSGDMRELPFADAMADLCLSVSGLHMIPDPERAIADMGRCVKPGGEIVGTTFLADGGLRQTLVFGLGSRTGHVAPTATASDLERWLGDAGFEAVEVQPRRGFAHFRGRKEQAAAAD